MSSWFPFRKSNESSKPDPGTGSGTGGTATGEFQPQPDKARKWFEHARVATLQANHAYALHCYAFGIKLDPGNMIAHQAMWETAVQYFNTQGKPATGKELRDVDGPGPVDRFAAAEFAWMKDLNSVSQAIRALESAAKAQQMEWGKWAAPRIKNIVFRQNQKKPSKKEFIAAKSAFAGVGAWEEAFQAGEQAVRLDPSDGQLMNELKELTAQRAIAQGGYAQNAGQEGSFRGSIRDADRQKALNEQDTIAGGADTEARNLERTRKDYEANPLSAEAVTRYAQLLRRSADGEEQAHEVYLKAFRELSEYRFRMFAGDIRITQAKRELSRLRDQLQRASAAPAAEGDAATGPDPALAAAVERQREAVLALETAEFRERATRYPTDRAIKFELGRLEFERGGFEDAMPHFQSAKEDARFRVAAAWMLGRAFAELGWHAEAIGEFREAIQALDASDKDRELEIKYDLMLSLIAGARADSSLAMAKEAAELCTMIIRRNIAFRDVRTKRKELDQLVRDFGGSVA